MKRLTILFAVLLSAVTVFSQQFDIQTTTLGNGMNVVLCEDHNQPQIYGAVCVHVGGKNDPSDNTGMAHYLEHLMFKGSDRIGTTDWKSEKIYLDSINILYDEVHDITDPDKREAILLRINELSNKAANYAIPNEVDVILSKMGGENVNAYTSNDVTVYYNSFPSNQLEKWLTVYTERFRRPVFRLFQSELEAVYEEFNMYQDQPINVFIEDAFETFYGKHPYGRPIIGYQHHLKNPQTSAMERFFSTYYQPTNMTLVLVGDFEISNIIPLLESTIGQLHNEIMVNSEMKNNLQWDDNGRMNTDLQMDVSPFNGHQIVTVSETPVKMGIIGFQTVGSHEKDAFILDILSNLFSNEAETGMIDKLTHDHRLMACSAFNYSMLEQGAFAFFYVPKLIGQSHEEAENLIFDAIDNIRKGNFSDDLFDAVKMEYLKNYLIDLESVNNKFQAILGMVSNKLSVEDFFEREEMIRNLDKEQLINYANKYFGNNCMCFRSNMGKKSQNKLQKPKWKPIVAQNTAAQSEFAQMIENMNVQPITTQTIHIGEDVKIQHINEDFKLYSAANPVNDIFSLDITFNHGALMNPLLKVAISYFSLQGTKDQSFNEFQLNLQKLGATMNMYATDDALHISISGFDKDMDKVLLACAEKLFHPGNDEKKLQIIIDEKLNEEKMRKNNADSWGRALYYYAMHGANSPYLTAPSLKELKSVTGEQLLSIIQQCLEFDGSVTYVGNSDIDFVSKIVKAHFLKYEHAKPGEKSIRSLETYEKPTIFIAANKNFLQSNLYFYTLCNPLEKMEQKVACTAYNEYMGGSMAGIIFQEIRELRSLGYSAYAYYNYDYLNRRPGYLMGYLGTQADKTIEGCEAMTELLVKFPERADKFELAKTSAISQKESEYIKFRNLPSTVEYWMEQGYQNDPRQSQLELLKSFTLKDLVNFYKENIDQHPIVITIAGDKKRINLKELSDKYQIIEVKYKDIFK